MVFLSTQSENHEKEIALCLNTCRWTESFGILRDETCIQCTGESQRLRIHRMGSDTERQMLSAASLAAVGTAMTSATAQISQPSYKTGNDPGKPELMG
jgi:hypothetical protein